MLEFSKSASRPKLNGDSYIIKDPWVFYIYKVPGYYKYEGLCILICKVKNNLHTA